MLGLLSTTGGGTRSAARHCKLQSKAQQKRVGAIMFNTNARPTAQSNESLMLNVNRLKAYKTRLVKFPRKKGQEWDDDMRSAVQATDPNVLPLPADKNDTEVRAITAEDKAPVYAKLRVERMNARVAGARKKAKEDAAAEKK